MNKQNLAQKLWEVWDGWGATVLVLVGAAILLAIKLPPAFPRVPQLYLIVLASLIPAQNKKDLIISQSLIGVLSLYYLTAPAGFINFDTTTIYRLASFFAVYPFAFFIVIRLKSRLSVLENQQIQTAYQETKNQLEQTSQQLEAVFTNMVDGVTVQAPGGKLLYINEAAAHMSGFKSSREMMSLPPEKLEERYKMVDEQMNPLSFIDLPGRIALAKGGTAEKVIGFIPKGQKEIKWSQVRAKAVADKSGQVLMVINLLRDITEEKNAREKLSKMAWRQKFLAEVGEILSSSLNYQENLSHIARLAVPHLADWAAVDMVSEPGKVERLAVAHQDPEKVKWAYEIQKEFPYDPNAPTGLANVIRTGNPEFYPVVPKELLDTAIKDPKVKKLLDDLGGISSAMTVPLKILNQTIGAISFTNTEQGKTYTEDALELAKELARRASLAIQNSRLFELAKQTAEREKEQKSLLDTLINNAPVGFIMLNRNMEYKLINKFAARLNNTPPETHIGKNIFDLYPAFRPELEPLINKVLQTGESILNIEIKGEIPTEPGMVRHWLANYYPIPEPNGTIIGIGMTLEDITEKKRADREIVFHAYSDALTLLPNRKRFQELIEPALQRARQANSKLGLMFIDMDRLKDINDSLGHQTGDEVIKEAAARIRRALPETDHLFRWGGDEFVVLAEGLQINYDMSRRAKDILSELRPEIRVGSHTLHVSASIGIAIFPSDGQDTSSLQRNADTALYRAKDDGKNQFQFYAPAMNIGAAEKLKLENELQKALGKNEFILFYQPVIEMKSRQIKSVEALLRWQHPQLGLLLPEKFLPAAEDLGIINELGEWALKKACADLKQLERQGMVLKASINVSARQFMEENLAEKILKIISEQDLSNEAIQLEITESLAMQNLDRTQTLLEELDREGIDIIIDDFGTGYSSLSYLKRFPIRGLKIDKSFVRHCITDEQDTSIIKAITSMAKNLDLRVVAEGVDTEMQLGLLESLGVDAAQGFLISKALSLDDLVKFLKSKQPVKKSENPNNTATEPEPENIIIEDTQKQTPA